MSPDQQFSNPRLAILYDEFDGERDDLDAYLGMVKEFSPSSILDVGCGTGALLTKLCGNEVKLVGIDPADASLTVAKRKAGKNLIQWVVGGTESIPAGTFDLVFMTGNVAQVFLTDQQWHQTLTDIRESMAPNGVFAFETRNPKARSWEIWNRENTFQSVTLPDIGSVDTWCEVTKLSLPFVSFQWTYKFASDGAVLTSQSTLRFRDREEIKTSLFAAGFHILDSRDAPDRPGKEMVFITNLN